MGHTNWGPALDGRTWSTAAAVDSSDAVMGSAAPAMDSAADAMGSAADAMDSSLESLVCRVVAVRVLPSGRTSLPFF